MIYENEEAISYEDVAICTQYSDLKSRSDVDISAINHDYPFIASPMWHLDSIPLMRFFMEKNMPYVLHRYFPTVEAQFDRWWEMTRDVTRFPHKLFVAVGSDEKWIGQLILRGIKSFCVDMANGNSMQAVNAVKFIREYCPDATIIAGNIESYDGFRRLHDAGARYFRIGIGSGSICSTNLNTGYGLPILTAIDSIYTKMTADEKEDSCLIADGGVRTAGDVAKAIAVGADYVMCGKLFASTSLARGPFFNADGDMLLDQEGVEERDDIRYVEYAGMASKLMREMAGGSQKTDVSEEGRAGHVDYAGTTESVFNQMCNSLRAVLAYSGCRTIPEFRKNAILQRVSPGGKFEKQVHLDKIYR
jgi:IMP dehydrogenase